MAEAVGLAGRDRLSGVGRVEGVLDGRRSPPPLT